MPYFLTRKTDCGIPRDWTCTDSGASESFAPVTKITIIPRTSGALGYTMQVEEHDQYLLSKEELENKIATYAGGRAAEALIFGSITTWVLPKISSS